MMERRPFRHLISLFGIALLCAPISACSSVSGSRSQGGVNSELRAELSATEVTDASVLLVTITLPLDMAANAEVNGRFTDKEIPFFPAPERGPGVHQALVGVPYLFDPGEATLDVQVREGESERTLKLPFRVTEAQYRSETLRVDPSKVSPSPKDLKRIRRESREVGAIYRTVTRERFWTDRFLPPMESELTSVFGNKRVFNGQLKSFHNGIDYRAPVGTPIYSSAPGKVVLAKDLFFTGKTVILDHGYGLYTLYAHMDQISVKNGQRVSMKAKLGLSGMTGRVSGPHLHWAVTLNRVKVNPTLFLQVFE